MTDDEISIDWDPITDDEGVVQGDGETDWPPGWTEEERIETVVAGKHLLEADARFTAKQIADEADAEIAVTCDVIADMIDRGEVEVDDIAGDEWLNDRDYSDTRWDNDD